MTRDPDAPTLLPEWAPQAGVLIVWPHAESDWGARLEAVEADYAALSRAIARHEPVLIACRDYAHQAHVRTRVADAGTPEDRVRYAVVPTDDTWVRDYGPLAVGAPGTLELVDFAFNAWGGKYPHAGDDRFTGLLHADGTLGTTRLRRESLVVEGGALESDGEGTLLTTAGCLDSESRNPGLGRDGVTTRLRAALGLEHVVWLDACPLPGDDTDGHVDTLVRFCAPTVIAHVTCADRRDPLHAPLESLARQLRGLRRPDGRPYDLVPLPLPAPQHAADGRRLPATYANFLIVNDAVLCPHYGDAGDGTAMERLAEAFPGREVVGVPARALIEENGSLHCATLQLPAGLQLVGTPGSR